MGAGLHRTMHSRGALVGHGTGCARSRGRPCFGFNRQGRGRGMGGYGWYGFGYGGLLEDPDALRDQGFFAETGDSWSDGGHAAYDYDRSYPYDWYRGPGATPAAAPPRPAMPMVRCDVTWVGGTRGAPSPVRVCRGRN